MTLRSRVHRLRIVALSVAGVLVAALPVAAAPRDELLRLVPADVGFCLVIQDLRTHADHLAQSPFAEQFRKSPIGTAIAGSPELGKIGVAEKEIQKHFGVTADQLRDEIYGDALVFAYRPAPDGRPEGEEGVFLLRARDKDLLARLVTRLNEIQKKGGELKELEERKHEGVTYQARVSAGGTHYYYLHGAVLAYTSQESMLKRVIDLDRRETREVPTILRDMTRLDVHDSMLTVWVNPRAFDAELKRKVAQAKPSEVHGLKRMQQYWQALDGAALTFTPRKSAFELSLAFLGRESEMPEPAKKFFSGDNRPSELWAQIPANALFAVAGRVDVPALAEFIGDFLPPDDRKKMREAIDRFIVAPSGGLDLTKDILPNLGPDWGICVLPPGPKEKAATPLMVAALRVRPGENKEKPVDRALFELLDRLAALAVFFNPDPVALKTTTLNKTEVKYLQGDKGAALNILPAYALKDGYLLVGSNPTVLSKFSGGKSVESSNDDCLLVRVSFRALRGYMKARLDAIAAALAEKNQISPEDARRKLEGIGQVLQLFDRLELSRRTGPNRVALTLRLHTEQPLVK